MNILVDENIPLMTVEALSKLGHKVIDHRGTSKEGLSDEDLWRVIIHEKALPVTTDKGFSAKRSEAHFGIVIVRLRQPNRQKIHEKVLRVMSSHSEEDWPGLMVVVRDNVTSTWSKRDSWQ
jgi:predicted nuclease of predicted toxin-antitoxin system